MDALSEVFRALHLEAGLFLEANFTAPWCIDSAPARENLHRILPTGDHVTLFHLVTEGRCRTRLTGGTDTIELNPGDIIVFPHGDAHLLGTDLHMAPVRAETLVRAGPTGGFLKIDHGGGDEKTRLMCGFLGFDRRIFRPLLEALPSLLHVPAGQGPAVSWMVSTLQHAADQSRTLRPGSRAVLARLSEMLFIEAIRGYMETRPEQAGWLAGLRDPHVGRALALLHDAPAKPWTVDSLAGKAAVSRSVLAERFAELIGEPPMQYLARWRMALAARALATTSQSLGRIAEQVGYESESAFNRAFKREFGMPPAAWRRMRRAEVPATTRGSGRSRQ